MQQVESATAETEPRSESKNVVGALELDRQLRRAERELLRCAFGSCASVVLRCGVDEEGAGEWQQSLCFGKLDGEWKLYLEAGLLDHPDARQRTDLFAADVETRVLAAKRVPTLVEALRTEELEQNEGTVITATARELGRFVDRLRRTMA